jgi:hypothetical protein
MHSPSGLSKCDEGADVDTRVGGWAGLGRVDRARVLGAESESVGQVQRPSAGRETATTGPAASEMSNVRPRCNRCWPGAISFYIDCRGLRVQHQTLGTTLLSRTRQGPEAQIRHHHTIIALQLRLKGQAYY